jgi:N-acetylglucosaminyldiphosphoundecaprenol N-acetyl-beta-D-mannosaminyltransferase
MANVDISTPERPFRKTRRADERVWIMGAQMDLIRPEEMLYFTARKIAAGEKAIIANHNLHSLYLVRRNPELCDFYKISDMIEVDSIPILMWARLSRRGGRRFHRCTYLDWRDLFWSRASDRGWRVYYLGAAPGVAERAAERLRAEWPGLQLAVRDGYFDMAADSAESVAIRAEIEAFGADVVMVGMGMPRQEAWVVRNHDRIKPCAIFTVGAAFDYEAGVQKAAPRWMGRMGVEWLFRLVVDPMRLFRRYCIEPWSLIPAALRTLAGGLARRKAAERRRTDRREDRPKDPANPGRRASDYRGLGSREETRQG